MATESSTPPSSSGDDLREKTPPGILSSVRKTLAFLATIIAVFMAVGNTVTYHLQHFWGMSGNFWQHQWDKVLDFYDHDDFKIFVYGPIALSYVLYWTVGSIFVLFDLTNLPSFIRPYKMQPGTNEPPSFKLVVKTFLCVSFNQIIAGLPFSMISYYIMTLRGWNRSPILPSFHWVLFELTVCLIVVEIGFYYGHRLLHHRMFYKRIHKIHHEWQSPIAIAALYCHPIEHVLSGMIPVFAGPMLMGAHSSTIYLWVSLATLNTLNAHCGYHLPFFPSPEAHDFHHLKFNQCFGTLGILDHLHGTDDKFKASRAFARHSTFLSFVPPRQLVPDIDPEAKVVKSEKCGGNAR